MKQNDTCKCSNVDVGHIYDRIFDCYNNDSRTVAYAVCKHMEKAEWWGKDSIKKSMATVNMTHIWVWSFLGRVAAVSAGIMSDLLILCICSILGLYNDSWIILAAASILWVRILWQFRFHRKTDGRLILMLLLDNPVIALGNENDADFTYEKDVLIWKVFQVIGVLVEIAVVVFWGIPFVLSIYTNLFV